MHRIHQLFFAAALVAAPSLGLAGVHELARVPSGIDTPAPAASPQAQPATKKITIYTAKTIVTQDPGTPTAEAVAVMDGKILGVGTLDQVKGWVTDEEVEIDRQFEDAVIVPASSKRTCIRRSLACFGSASMSAGSIGRRRTARWSKGLRPRTPCSAA